MSKLSINPEVINDFVEISHRVAVRGLTTGTGGGISVRISAQDIVLIKGYDVACEDLKPEDIAIVDLSGKSLNDVMPCLETPLHMEVLKTRRNIGAVIHAHAPYSTAFGNLKPMLMEGVLKNDVSAHKILAGAVFTPSAKSGSEQLAHNVGKPFQNEAVTCVFMQDHGVTVAGKNIYHAYSILDSLEGRAKSFIWTTLLKSSLA